MDPPNSTQQGGLVVLVITRRAGECVGLGGGIVVRVLGVEGRRVRIGIEAPRNVPVRRGELTLHPSEAAPPAGQRPAWIKPPP